MCAQLILYMCVCAPVYRVCTVCVSKHDNLEIVLTCSFLTSVFNATRSFSSFFVPFLVLSSLFPFIALHFFSTSPLLLNKSFSYWTALFSAFHPLFSYSWHSYLPVYISFLLLVLPFIFQLLSPHASFSSLFFLFSISQCHTVTLSWIGSFFFLLLLIQLTRCHLPN